MRARAGAVSAQTPAPTLTLTLSLSLSLPLSLPLSLAIEMGKTLKMLACANIKRDEDAVQTLRKSVMKLSGWRVSGPTSPGELISIVTKLQWYAVGKGPVSGMYKTYVEAEQQVIGVSEAKHKPFRSKMKVREFVYEHFEVLT